MAWGSWRLSFVSIFWGSDSTADSWGGGGWNPLPPPALILPHWPQSWRWHFYSLFWTLEAPPSYHSRRGGGSTLASLCVGVWSGHEPPMKALHWTGRLRKCPVSRDWPVHFGVLIYVDFTVALQKVALVKQDTVLCLSAYGHLKWQYKKKTGCQAIYSSVLIKMNIALCFTWELICMMGNTICTLKQYMNMESMIVTSSFFHIYNMK